MRILIADDSEMVRRGVRALLSVELGWTICGEATDGAEALEKARQLLPDIVLLDISMPGESGLEIARRLRLELPKVKILVISQHDPSLIAASVMEAGGDACLDKARLAPDLVATIKNLK